MSQLSDYLENALINAVLRNAPYTSPTTVYAALFTSDPTDAGTGTEVTGGSYVRMPIALTAPADGQTSNLADVLYPIATASWGTITHVGLYDAQSGGNLLFHAPLEFAKTINISSQFKIPQSYLIVKLK